MAPEMLKSGVYSLSADIFSFGIILGEMMARERANPEVWQGARPKINRPTIVAVLC
jgi:hypothetical protein